MRNRTAIQVMEQIIMIGVFALAAAVCLQAYAVSYNVSVQAAQRNEALRLANAVTEQVRSGQTKTAEGLSPFAVGLEWTDGSTAVLTVSKNGIEYVSRTIIVRD